VQLLRKHKTILKWCIHNIRQKMNDIHYLHYSVFCQFLFAKIKMRIFFQKMAQYHFICYVSLDVEFKNYHQSLSFYDTIQVHTKCTRIVHHLIWITFWQILFEVKMKCLEKRIYNVDVHQSNQIKTWLLKWICDFKLLLC
jgi:hypothetical protein